MDSVFTGEGGRLRLTDGGVLYGSGWNLTFPYGVAYSEAEAKAAEPVKIAEEVVSAAAGYNYALYVTADGTLHFVGDSGIPFRERFFFEGRIREVFAKPDRDEFSLIDIKGDRYAWGDNVRGQIEPLRRTIRAVVKDEKVTLQDGFLIWEYRQDGKECRRRGTLMNYPVNERRCIVLNRLVGRQTWKDVSREYGADNIVIKYVLQSESEKREIRSPDWSAEEYSALEPLDQAYYPHGPGITDVRRGAYRGWEKDYVYSAGIYTCNYYIYRPVRTEVTVPQQEGVE